VGDDGETADELFGPLGLTDPIAVAV
jgi:hypothetical protein